MVKPRSLISYILFLIVFDQLIANEFDFDKNVVNTKHLSFEVSHFSDGYEIPWGMAFLPDHRMLVTDISGSLWL